MTWIAINTLTTGAVPASHFNTLNANGAFLNAIVTRSNVPCPCVQRNDILDFTGPGNHFYTFRHRLRYLHYRLQSHSNTLDYIRVFYNEWKVAENDAPPASPYTFQGAADIYSPSTWPNHLGAWASSTAYAEGRNGDGDIVGRGGSYYKCILNHTSGASSEPGVGGSWQTYWTQWVAPAIGGLASAHAQADYTSGSGELAIEYLIEREHGA